MRMIKITLVFVALVLVGVVNHASAQGQRFDWKFYNRAPVLTLEDKDDLTIVRVLSGEEGKDNQLLMTSSLCLVYYGSETCPERFVNAVMDHLRQGKWRWKTYAQGNTDLDHSLAHGVMVKGVRKAAITKAPPIIHTLDKNNKPVNPRARLLDPIELPVTGKWVRVAIFEDCYNVSGEDASAPPPPPPALVVEIPAPVVEVPPPAPAPRVEPTPSPTPRPRLRRTPPPVYIPPPVIEEDDESGSSLTAGIGLESGSATAVYADPIPNRGYVPNTYRFQNLFGFVDFRGDWLHCHVAGTLTGSTSDIQFQDLKGDWVTKRRQTDESRDKWVETRCGVLYTNGPLSVGAFGGWERHGFYQNYFEGVATEAPRYYSGLVAGFEGILATDSDKHKLSIDGRVTFGRLKRKSYTQQQGFPFAPNADQDATSVGLHIGADWQLYGPIHVFAAYNSLRIDSSQVHPFLAASEVVKRNAGQVGVKFVWD